MAGFETVAEDVGARIRDLRRATGMTQAELAQKAGVFDVGEIERGRKVKGGVVNPRLETLYKIAVALDVDISELFGQMPDGFTLEMSTLLSSVDDATKSKALQVVRVMVGE